jgi:Spy/CpxP family protein refolding chaperone
VRKFLVAAVAASSLFFVHVPAASAVAATDSSAWCAKRQASGKYYYKHDKHWDCVSPGAFCAKAQYNQFGYSMRAARHAKRYKCVRYPSNTWHWKPV